jgi:uncharacterized protein (TIGR03435 family)
LNADVARNRFNSPAIASLAIVFLPLALLCGQSPLNASAQDSVKSSKPLSFEVATIKQSKMPPNGLLGIYTYPGGIVKAGLCTVDVLISSAFQVQTFQVVGGPKWIHTNRYDIVAKPPADSVRTGGPGSEYVMSPEQRQMLQSLLVERFQLKFHRANEAGSIYVLEKRSKQLKMTAPKDSTLPGWAGSNVGGGINGDGLKGVNISMPELASRLSSQLNRPVVDRTGIAGRFDFAYEYHSEDQDADAVSSLITSLQEIGLKLKSDRGSIETIVIDSIQTPSEN